jgi:hypothetical protein
MRIATTRLLPHDYASKAGRRTNKTSERDPQQRCMTTRCASEEGSSGRSTRMKQRTRTLERADEQQLMRRPLRGANGQRTDATREPKSTAG